MMTPILRSLLWSAARHLATNPRVQAQAARAYRKARPAAESLARSTVQAVRDAPPLRDPAAFARTLRDRLRQPR
ncbi:MAG: hypothetical protein H6842_05245 [Rhodospirillaceae bacterium]|nr:hypothetical protein [Rhodospirillaceae bacterium]